MLRDQVKVAHLPGELLSLEDPNDLRLDRAAGHLHRTIRMNEHIDLAADAEFRQVDSRLDRKQRSRQYAASFVRLQIVDVSSVAVCFPAETVSGTVAECFAVPGIFDHAPDGIINLPAL